MQRACPVEYGSDRVCCEGYHECGFTVTAGEIFFLEKKISSRGRAFGMVICKGQLGQEKSIIVNENRDSQFSW